MLDLRFCYDILSGGDSNLNAELSRSTKSKYSFRQKQDQRQNTSVTRTRMDGFVKQLAQRLDPIDWLT